MVLISCFVMALLSGACTQQRGRVEQAIAFTPTSYQVETIGKKTVFETGFAYRRPRLPVQVSVSGTHYEMGKQYGVLLQAEIREVAKLLYQLAHVVARDQHIPVNQLYRMFRDAVMTVAERTPHRLQEEINGIADGSGVPVETIYMINLFDEAIHVMNKEQCTSIVLRTADGKILHGRNQDTPGRLELMDYAIVVKFHPTGYHTVVSVNPPAGYIGVNAGYNSAGLAVTNNGISLKEVYYEGMKGHFITRMALEECETLKEVETLYGTYSEVAGSAYIWSDGVRNQGVMFETAPPGKYSVVPMKESLLIQSNMCADQEFIDHLESPFESQSAYNLSRKRINDQIEQKTAYTIHDMLMMLRADTGPDGRNYNKSAFLSGISNAYTIGMVIFAPDRMGFYYASNPYHASWSDVYYYADDFEQPPVLYAPAIPLDPVVEDVSRIAASGAYTRAELVEQYRALAAKYPKEAYVQALVGLSAFRAEMPDIWADYMMRAVTLDPGVPEYMVEAGAVAYWQGKMKPTIDYLLNVHEETLSSLEYKGKRLALLANAYKQTGDLDQARTYQDQFEQRIQEEPYHLMIQEYVAGLRYQKGL